MSAYICDDRHFLYLIGAAMSHRLNVGQGSFSWYHNGARHELACNDYERAAEVANMLLCENMRSVSHRYPHESSATLPGPKSGVAPFTSRSPFTSFDAFEPAQVLKAIHCLEYQSCEHDEWRESESFAFLQALSGRACRSMIGYEDAEWGAPKPAARRNAA